MLTCCATYMAVLRPYWSPTKYSTGGPRGVEGGTFMTSAPSMQRLMKRVMEPEQRREVCSGSRTQRHGELSHSTSFASDRYRSSASIK